MNNARQERNFSEIKEAETVRKGLEKTNMKTTERK